MSRSLAAPCALLLLGTASALPAPPAAKRVPVELEAHGEIRVDPYYWMRDLSDPDVLAYLVAENAYAESVLACTGALREDLYDEMVERLPQEDVSVPWELDGWWYGERYEEGSEYPVYFRRDGSPDGEEQVLLDLGEMATGRDYLALEAMSVSPDGSLIAMAFDTLGDHWDTILFLDISSGEFLPDSVGSASSDIAWSADSRSIFCGLLDETGRTGRIVSHELLSGGEDRTVFFEDDSTFWPWVYESRSREWIIIGTESTDASEYLLIPAASPDSDPVPVLPRSPGTLYSIAFAGDSLYIRTDLDAENFRLVRTTAADSRQSTWTEVLPGRDDVLLEGVEGFRDYMVVRERQGGIPLVRAREIPGGEWHPALLPPGPCEVWPLQNYEYDTGSVRLSYSSLTTPWSTLACDMASGEIEFLKTQTVNGYDPSLYESLRLFAPAHDGHGIPVSMVYRRDLLRRGENPLVLYGYGAYGYSNDPYFGTTRLSLLDRGFIYAIAHVRGGQELGRAWYEEGRLLSKRNTFEDFIACAEYLASEAWCDPDRIFGVGESAGGLLIGAVANMRPDLWRGLVAGVPFVDVVTTMLDETIPLTTNEYSEWGNPADPVYYDHMMSWSPYDNVTPVEYPAMLVTAGLHDSQVGYWEPAKWVAKLRSTGTGSEPLLFHTELEAGHGGVSGRFSSLRGIALEYAFIIWVASGEEEE
ncbi:S9 family peptidase [Candidatus Fermentibacterales bacterium]|nr:S9 family peptidase [Candidatus Fermentibacterales bacterium]